jgi:hypothetical protein
VVGLTLEFRACTVSKTLLYGGSFHFLPKLIRGKKLQLFNYLALATFAIMRKYAKSRKIPWPTITIRAEQKKPGENKVASRS